MNRRTRTCGRFLLPFLCVPLAAAPATFESAYRAGLDALAKNDPAAAQMQFEAASKLQPRNPQVWLALAQTYFKLNKTAPAADAAVRAETLAPGDPVILHGLAFYYTEAHQPLRAAALEARYADKAPQDHEAYGRAVDLYLRASHPKPAILLAQKALARGDTPGLRELLAKAYDADGQFEKAVEQYGQAAKLRPYDEGYMSELGQAYLRHKQYAEALRIFQFARQRFDKSAPIELGLGEALQGLNRFPEAIDAFLLTIQLDPESEQPYLLLGGMIDQAGSKLPDLSAALGTFVSVKPNSFMSNLLYAKALIAQNAEPDQVEPLLRKSIALDNAFWESHYELGVALEKKLDFAGAVVEFEKSLQLNSKNAAAHTHLARVYDRLGKPEFAAKQRALQGAPSAPAK